MNWKIYKTQHYTFHYFSGTLAEKEIEKIADGQEAFYRHILSYLNLKNERTINYFLYPANQLKGEIMGDDGNGNTNREKFEVHAVYNENIKCIGAHEDTHLLSLPLGLATKLFREGLAEFMSKEWHGKTHDFWARKFLSEKKIPKLSKILNDKEWDKINDSISYPCAGSFCTFLISKIGKGIFLKLYGALDRNINVEINLVTIKDITSKSLDQWQKEWAEKVLYQ